MAEGRNFDQVHPDAEERSFVLAGETFHWRPVWWRDFGQMVEDAVTEAQQQLKQAEEQGDDAIAPTMIDSYEDVIARIMRYIEPGDVDRLRAVIDDRDKNVSDLQLTELRDWLQESAHNRPTQQPSPSDAGRGSGEATLRAV